MSHRTQKEVERRTLDSIPPTRSVEPSGEQVILSISENCFKSSKYIGQGFKLLFATHTRKEFLTDHASDHDLIVCQELLQNFYSRVLSWLVPPQEERQN